jgi:hypothetical protein
MMISSNEKKQYQEEGYLLLRNVYSESEVQRARALIDQDFQSGGWSTAPYHNEGVTTDIYERIPELADIVFNSAFMTAVKELFQPEPVILAEPAVHRSRYYYWHKDSTFIDEQGDDYHWRSNFQAAMTVFYLQANHQEEGGGITVIPGSHRDPDFYHKIPTMNILQRAWLKGLKLLGLSHFDRLDKHSRLTEIASQAGDLLILDMRIDHKGTPARKSARITKYGIMNIACSGYELAERLRSSLRNRNAAYYQNYLKAQKRSSPVLSKKGKEFEDIKVWQ